MKTTPTQLRTPTDLDTDSVDSIVEVLNPIIADSFSLYIKTKSFHWHVYGPYFNDYHKLFDKQAEHIFESIDTLAERVRKLGKVTITGLQDIIDMRTIEDCDDLPDAQEMISELLEDNRDIVASMRSAIDICESNNDKPTANILQSLLDETERRVWFLFELTQ